METPASHVALSIQRIRRFRKAKNWTVNRLAREAGLRESSIRHLDDARWNPESKTLVSLEAIIPADFKVDAADKSEGAQSGSAGA